MHSDKRARKTRTRRHTIWISTLGESVRVERFLILSFATPHKDLVMNFL